MEVEYNAIHGISEKSIWEKFVYSKRDLTPPQDITDCYFICTYLEQTCNVFVYQSGKCYLGSYSLSSGKVTEVFTETTIYITDQALTFMMRVSLHKVVPQVLR